MAVCTPDCPRPPYDKTLQIPKQLSGGGALSGRRIGRSGDISGSQGNMQNLKLQRPGARDPLAHRHKPILTVFVEIVYSPNVFLDGPRGLFATNWRYGNVRPEKAGGQTGMALDPLKVIGLFVPRLRKLWQSRNELAVALERSERRLGFFQGEYHAATEAIEDLRKATQRQRLQNEELDVHIRLQEEELHRQQEEIQQLREQVNRSQAQETNDTLLALHETIALLTSQRDKIWQQFDILSARNAELAEAVAAKGEAAQQVKAAQEETDRLKQVVAELEDALARHRSELAELRAQRQGHEDLKASFYALQSGQEEANRRHSQELEALATERDALLAALAEARKSIAETNQRRDEMLQEHDAALGDRLRLQGEIEKLQAEHAAIVASLRDRLDRSQNDFGALFNRMLKAENDTADQEAALAQAEVTAYEAVFGNTAVRKRAFLHIGGLMPGHPLWQQIRVGQSEPDSTSVVWEPDYPEALPVPERAIHLAYIGWQLAHCDDRAIAILLKDVARTLREDARIRLVVPDSRLVLTSLLNSKREHFGDKPGNDDALSLGQRLARVYRWQPASGSNTGIAGMDDKQLRQGLTDWLANGETAQPWLFGKDGPNLLTESRLRKLLSGAGFTNISRSAYQQSESDFLRDATYFDAESPSLSLFMEATRSAASTSVASRKPAAGRPKVDR